MILFLDTTGVEVLIFATASQKSDGGKIILRQKKFKISPRDSEKTLELLLKFLPKNFRAEKIFVVSGPGSFSGIRTGIAIAMAFGLAWGADAYAIPKNKIPKNLNALIKIKGRLITAGFNPDYGAAPKITQEKNKNLRHT